MSTFYADFDAIGMTHSKTPLRRKPTNLETKNDEIVKNIDTLSNGFKILTTGLILFVLAYNPYSMFHLVSY